MTGNGDFELASVSRELIEKFSKRTLEIDRLCKEKYTILEALARKLPRETLVRSCSSVNPR